MKLDTKHLAETLVDGAKRYIDKELEAIGSPSDTQKAFDAGFDAIRGYVDRSLSTAYARIKALEERAKETEAAAPKPVVRAAAKRAAV